MGLAELLEKYEPKLWQEFRLLEEFSHIPPSICEMVWYQLRSGGKRIRPLLSIMVEEAVTKREADKVIPFAAAIELLHNASLVHDDIQDKDSTRRGQPSLWSVFSMEQAINLGDLLFLIGFELFFRLSLEAERKLSLLEEALATVRQMVAGQILDLQLRGQAGVCQKDYFTIVEQKTAALFAFTLSGTALVLDLPAHWQRDLRQFGQALGVFFQIRDDLIDLLGRKEGRCYGEDIREGKITLPLVFALEQSEHLEKLLEILRLPKEETSQEQVDWVIELYEHTGALMRTYEVLQQWESRLLESSLLQEESPFSLFVREVVGELHIEASSLEA